MKLQIKTLAEIVLDKIYSECLESEKETIIGSSEIWIDEKPYGEVSYIVEQQILSPSCIGYKNNPPQTGESEFYLVKASLNDLVNENSKELTCVMKSVNNILSLFEGKEIEFSNTVKL